MVNYWSKSNHNDSSITCCVLCGGRARQGYELCQGCENDLPNLGPRCYCCALPLTTNEENHICGHCLKKTPHYDRVVAGYRYAEPLSGLIQGFKFNQQLQNGRLLGGLMLRQLIDRTEPLPQLLIPVPLHPSRVRERGFNQSKELGGLLSRVLGVPLDYRSVQRSRATTAQSGLTAKERQRNIKGAFDVVGQINARHVALVDDVMTTGSTVNELARLVKKTGVNRVEVWVAARAV